MQPLVTVNASGATLVGREVICFQDSKKLPYSLMICLNACFVELLNNFEVPGLSPCPSENNWSAPW